MDTEELRGLRRLQRAISRRMTAAMCPAGGVMTKEQAAKALGVGIVKMGRLILAGEVTMVTVGRRLMVPAREVRRVMRERPTPLPPMPKRSPRRRRN